MPVPVSPSSSTEASLAAMRRGEIEQGRAGRFAAGGARRGPDQFGGERIAEGEIGLAIAQIGGRGRGGADQRGRAAKFDDDVAGRAADFVAAGADCGAGAPALLRRENARAQPGAGQPAGQGRIGVRRALAQSDHQAPPK